MAVPNQFIYNHFSIIQWMDQGQTGEAGVEVQVGTRGRKKLKSRMLNVCVFLFFFFVCFLEFWTSVSESTDDTFFF